MMEDDAKLMLTRVRFAEKAERFDEMVDFVKTLVREIPDLLEKQGELDLVSVAFKNAVGERRSSWRVMKTELMGCSDEASQTVAREFMKRLEMEITTICKELLDLIDKHLLDVTTSPEGMVLLLKLKGDYSRYLTEIQSGDERNDSIASADSAYNDSMAIAKKELSPAHPNMLGLVLNMSLFNCVILEDYVQACKIAKKGIGDAEGAMGELEDSQREESNRILQIIKDNLEAWTSDG